MTTTDRRGPLLYPKSNLQLAETRTFGNGVVLLRYQRPDTQSAETRGAQAL
jgi:hypothetical protein